MKQAVILGIAMLAALGTGVADTPQEKRARDLSGGPVRIHR
jgi:hypothetical protein